MIMMIMFLAVMKMANGHGGKRAGAGRPKKPLADKILEDTTKKHRPKILNIDGADDPPPEPPEWIGYYNSKTVGKPDVVDVYKTTVEWLKQTGCLHLVPPEYISDYAIIKTTWYEAQRMITRLGLVYTPEEKKVCDSPLNEASFRFYKMAEMAWDKIWRIVAQNCETDFGRKSQQDEIMENLLRRKFEE